VSDGLVDWGLAEKLGHRVAGSGADGPPDYAALNRTFDDARERVAAYTQLRPQAPPPPPEAIGRRDWVANALGSIRELAADVDQAAAQAVSLPGPIGGISRRLLGTGAAAEAGTVVGLAARRVLGQYDVSLIDSERPPRLLFVWPNLAEAERRLEAERETFLHWIALHEVTHAVQFGSVDWLAPHLGGLVRELLESSARRLDKSSVRDAARRTLGTDPRRVASALLQGELVKALAGPKQAAILDRAQATMAVVEGHAEHVMDAAAADLGPEYAELRRRLDAKREGRTGLEAIIGRLLGMEMKLRQYTLGKAFCDAVVAEAGVEGLNRVWASPEALPTLLELERPAEWLHRVGHEGSVQAA
jgi:coenzyme F420 biosynthesis associated uncharacterized protein